MEDVPSPEGQATPADGLENTFVFKESGSLTTLPPLAETKKAPSRSKRRRSTAIDTMVNALESVQTSEEVVQALKMMGETIKALAEEVKELQKITGQCKCRQEPTVHFLSTNTESKRQFPTPDKSRTTTDIPPPRLRPETYAQVVTKRGNDRPAAATPRRAVVGPGRIVGSARDKVEFAQPDVMTAEDSVTLVNPGLAKQLALPPPREPQSLEATVYCIEKVQPRDKCTSGEWRKILKERSIQVYSVLRPYRTTVELLVRKEDAGRMKAFLAEISKTPADPNPYLRRDGQPGPLDGDVTKRLVERRISMLQWETSGVGIRYLEGVIMLGIRKITPTPEKEKLLQALKDTMAEKRWSLSQASS